MQTLNFITVCPVSTLPLDEICLTFLHADYSPNQDGLTTLLKDSKPDEDVSEWLKSCKRWGATEGIDKITSEHAVDVVVCCSDSYFAGVSVAAGE